MFSDLNYGSKVQRQIYLDLEHFVISGFCWGCKQGPYARPTNSQLSMLSPSVHETTHTNQCNAVTHLSQFLLDTNVTKYLVTDSAFGFQDAFCKIGQFLQNYQNL